MNNIPPELQDWEQIKRNADNTHPNSFPSGPFVRAMEKVVYSIANAGLKAEGVTSSVFQLKKHLEVLNKNIEKFNEESSKWAKRAFWISITVAFGTLITAIAALISITNK